MFYLALFKNKVYSYYVCWYIMLLLSVIKFWLYFPSAGLGFSFLYLTSMVATTVYFSRWRALAVGLASCGSGIGIIVYPLLASHVIDVLNWQWCLRIQAGIIFLCLLLSLIFRPLTSEVKVEKPTMREALKASFKLSLLKSPFFILFMIIACVSTIGR